MNCTRGMFDTLEGYHLMIVQCTGGYHKLCGVEGRGYVRGFKTRVKLFGKRNTSLCLFEFQKKCYATRLFSKAS